MFRLSIFNSDQNAAATFLARVALFLTPLLIFTGAFEYMLFRTGDSWSVDRVVRIQSGLSDYIYGRGLFSQQFNVYKYKMLRQREPRIVILGSSRVMQIRDFFFHPLEKDVYNAGGLIQTVGDVEAYGRLVADGELPRPDAVILGIDPWWLRIKADSANWLTSAKMRDEAFQFSAHVSVAQRLVSRRDISWRAVEVGAPGPSPFHQIPAIGAHALVNGVGFRPDGSRQYAPRILIDFAKNPRFVDRLTPPAIFCIRNNTRMYRLPISVDWALVDRLGDTLMKLRAMGVEVFAFVPPYSDEASAALDSSSTLQDWWREFREDVPFKLNARGLSCMPISRPSLYGLDDLYMYDGTHQSEVFAARVIGELVRMAPDGSLLNKVDLGYVEALLAAPTTNPLSFTPPPSEIGE